MSMTSPTITRASAIDDRRQDHNGKDGVDANKPCDDIFLVHLFTFPRSPRDPSFIIERHGKAHRTMGVMCSIHPLMNSRELIDRRDNTNFALPMIFDRSGRWRYTSRLHTNRRGSLRTLARLGYGSGSPVASFIKIGSNSKTISFRNEYLHQGRGCSISSSI
jgi:hypothetical protein